MTKLLAVGLGGAIGSIARYLIAVLAEKADSLNFPLSTFFVNISGSLLIGFCWSFFERVHISHEFRLFLFTGLLGGFTTFSTFTREATQFFKAGETFHALSYLFLSNAIGLAAVFFGFYLSLRLPR